MPWYVNIATQKGDYAKKVFLVMVNLIKHKNQMKIGLVFNLGLFTGTKSVRSP